VVSGGRPVQTRGDVWLAARDPTIGSEIQKTRPCLVISPADLNDYLRTVLVAPMTTAGFPAPYRISIRFQGRTGLILLDQIRAVDKSRLVRRLGRVRSDVLTTTLATLRELFED
jgi:mRNA interferase MazF